MTLLENIKKELQTRNDRSAWSKGVTLYALELVESLEEFEDYNGKHYTNAEEIKSDILNGADNWAAYSWGGSSLIYDGDICERLATPSEQRRTRGGELRPNSREEWLDTQARALFQASNRISKLAHKLTH